MSDQPQKISIFEDDGWWLVDRTPCKEDNDPIYYAESVPQALADALQGIITICTTPPPKRDLEVGPSKAERCEAVAEVALELWEKIRDD